MDIKDLRNKKFLSQEQLAELSGLSLRTIQRVEGGQRVSYASLRALAAAFNIDVDELEHALYAKDIVASEYKDFPLWLRLYIGSGWFSATRKEFKKTEIFFLIMGSLFAVVWAISSLMELSVEPLAVFACLSCFFGAYNVSISIRIGDKYDVWSKLELTLPKTWFGFIKKNKNTGC